MKLSNEIDGGHLSVTDVLPIEKSFWLNEPLQKNFESIELNGENLTIDQVIAVAKFHAQARLTHDKNILSKIAASCDYVLNAVEAGKTIYGVNTNFGGLVNINISKDDVAKLQTNLFWFLKAGTGNKLPEADIRAGMLLRTNSLMRGISGIRLEILERIITFLNANATPHVYEFGSIGASGDLIPLAYVGASVIGLDRSYKVDMNGETLDAMSALEKLHLSPIKLQPKEGLAFINGTSMMTGIAANCMHDAKILLHLTIHAHAFFLQALKASPEPLDPFIHRHKPHPGQSWIASRLLNLIQDSLLIKKENVSGDNHLLQDRYSIRCLAQYMGPIVDGFETIAHHITTEANSATDNPIFDLERGKSLHGGNFLGQYIGIGMDQLRYYLGLLAKHLDVQIASLVTPAFNNGLSPSLIGNENLSVNAGLKGLQLCGNSIMPVLLFLGNSLADKFPTYAEQFNQDINSQGYMSSNLARQSISTFQEYIAICLLFGIQAVDLRTYREFGYYDARVCLSAKTVALYETIKNIIGKPASKERPYIWNDDEQSLDSHIAAIVNDIRSYGKIMKAMA